MPRNAAPRGNFQYFPEQIETYFDHFSYRWTTEEGGQWGRTLIFGGKIIHKMTFSLIPARTSCNTPWANGARTTSDTRGSSGARTSFTQSPHPHHRPTSGYHAWTTATFLKTTVKNATDAMSSALNTMDAIVILLLRTMSSNTTIAHNASMIVKVFQSDNFLFCNHLQ